MHLGCIFKCVAYTPTEESTSTDFQPITVPRKFIDNFLMPQYCQYSFLIQSVNFPKSTTCETFLTEEIDKIAGPISC